MAQATTYTHRRHDRQVKVASGLDLAVGAWLFISAFFINSGSPAAFWNALLFGAVVVILAATRLGNYGRVRSWPSWVNAVIGVWVLIAPWALGFAFLEGPRWNHVICGIAIAVLATWSALSTDSRDSAPARRV